ncbi:hypothetical protein H4582DRAFT_2075755 [Lactarius indigo]|nr:hypothetical protein H4582DRAFT_2075755 [Lactarius indigo]
MYRKYANSLLVVLVSALSVTSIILTHTLFAFVKNVQFKTNVMKKEHSLLGDDWPPYFPLTLERKVEMVVEESVHYAVGGPGAEDEWWYERGIRVRRRGTHRRQQPDQLTNRTNKHRFPHHQHCLNYLRQQALCHPDLTLEPGDFATRDFEVDRVGQTHTCRDFDTAWDYSARNWLDWYYFLKETRLSTTPSLEPVRVTHGESPPTIVWLDIRALVSHKSNDLGQLIWVLPSISLFIDKSEDHNDAERWGSIALSNRSKTILYFGFVIIAVCTVLDSVLLISLGYRYAQSVWYPADPTKLETPSTYINFDLLYRNGTKTDHRFPPIQVSFMAAYGTVPYNDRRLLVEPEISTFVQFRALDYGMENCSLALHIPEYGSDAMEIAHLGSTIDVWSLAVDSKIDFAEAVI